MLMPMLRGIQMLMVAFVAGVATYNMLTGIYPVLTSIYVGVVVAGSLHVIAGAWNE